jgi:hypothetical protein
VKATDYQLTDAEADSLKGVVQLPYDIRHEVLTHYAKDRGHDALASLFAQFIGMANSVIANNREMAEMMLITEGNMLPQNAEKINLPTLFGALQGVALANSTKQAGLCSGCAYRLGAAANQSPPTTSDAEYCVQEGNDFNCHEKLDERGNPTKLCIGHARATKRLRQTA